MWLNHPPLELLHPRWRQRGATIPDFQRTCLGKATLLTVGRRQGRCGVCSGVGDAPLQAGGDSPVLQAGLCSPLSLPAARVSQLGEMPWQGEQQSLGMTSGRDSSSRPLFQPLFQPVPRVLTGHGHTPTHHSWACFPEPGSPEQWFVAGFPAGCLLPVPDAALI